MVHDQYSESAATGRVIVPARTWHPQTRLPQLKQKFAPNWFAAPQFVQ